MRTMFYPKNVPNLEREIRFAAGSALILLALFGQGVIVSFGVIGQIVLILSAVTLMATGFVGWCPACALVGRKIKKSSIQ